MYKATFLFLVIISLASCRGKGAAEVDLGYFSTEKYLDSLKNKFGVVTVDKTVTYEGKTEMKPESDLIHLLLSFLKDFELNKVANKDAYNIAITTDTSGRQVYQYTLKEEFKLLPVRRLVIIDGDGDKDNVTVAGFYYQANLLSSIDKSFEVRFNKKGGFVYSVFNSDESLKTGKKQKLTVKCKATSPSASTLSSQ